MAVEMNKVKRQFVYAGARLVDVDAKMSVEEIKAHYSIMYPELSNATIGKREFVGNKEVIHFEVAVGTKA